MNEYRDELGQPIGEPLNDWSAPPPPARAPIEGSRCRLEPLDADRHAANLHAANRLDAEGRMWTYLPYGPFASADEYRAWVERVSRGADPLFFAVVDRGSGEAVGVASYLRIDPPNGAIEVGHLAYSPRLQRGTVATEAMFLMMERAFALGYRRYEWKCNALNEPSRVAAVRLGFTFEGIFRQAAVVKGRNRDTAWYSILDREWPPIRAAYRSWLAPENFDAEGRQRSRLSALVEAARAGA